jgi:hypothetical protein
MPPTRIEKHMEKQRRKAARELEASFPPDQNNALKKRRPPAKKKSKGGGRVLDQGADLHYRKNKNGFPSARLNSKEIGDDSHLLGVSDRFDDEVPSLDPEAVVGRGSMRPLLRPREESENESGYENDARERDAIVEDLTGHLSQVERDRVIESMRKKAADAAQEKAGNPRMTRIKSTAWGTGLWTKAGKALGML